ncbi:MAG: hypothetical protein J1E40_01495 [Oscillospiraceae bacterium]|nr:hypothetical protein [Oscillospiraceae bacterium]
MTERESQLLAELNSEKERNQKILGIIKKRQDSLKKSDAKISNLELAVKEEQLNSIRESIIRNGFDFDSFRAALDKGLVQTVGTADTKKPDTEKTTETTTNNDMEEFENENE